MGRGWEGFVGNNYGYGPQQNDFDPTVSDSFFNNTTQQGYPGQSRYAPPPMRPNTIGNMTTVQQTPWTVRRNPRIGRGSGDGMALASLLLGLLSAGVGWLPVCGIVALFPALVGIVFGWAGLRSRRRNMAILGLLLCALGLAMALAIVV